MNSSIKLLLGLMAVVPALHATSVKLGVISGTSGTDSVDIQSVRSTSSMVAAGDYAIAIGVDNTAETEGCIAIGGFNLSTGTGYASAFGYYNEVDGVGAAAFGGFNTVYTYSDPGAACMAFGASNDILGDDSYAFGSGNSISANYAVIFGRGITNGTASSVMIGPSNTAKVTILSTGYVGIGLGTTAPTQMLEVGGNIKTSGTVTAASDVEITDSTKGLILKSPNGTRFRITISNAGVLTATSL